jgi:hypothetical protein
LDCRVLTAVVLILSLLFGGLDQYLGSFSAHPWLADVSGLSAPWLVLPFAIGGTQSSARRACLIGGVGTFLALVGYCVMTLSPLENAHLSHAGIVAFVVTGGNWHWFLAGAVTGPLAGWLGHLWRYRHVRAGGLAAGALLLLEPFVRLQAGTAVRSHKVAAAEIVAGAVCAAAVAVRARRSGPDGLLKS